MAEENILKRYTLEEIYMIKLSTNNDKNSIIRELINLRNSVGNDLKIIVTNCIEKVMRAENSELQEVLDFPIE